MAAMWRIAAGWALGFTLIDGSAALSVVKVTQAEVDYRGEAGYSQELRQAAEMEAETENHSNAEDVNVNKASGSLGSIFDSPFRLSPEMSLAVLPAYYVRHSSSFPTIRRGANVSDVFSPFAKVRTRIVPVQPHNTFATAVDVEIATPEIIVSVYLLLFVPLAMAWAYFEKHYLIMVPFTLCAFTVGLDLVNQSLSTLTAAPMAMTAIQAGFMSAATMLWTVGCHVYMLIARLRGHEAPPPLVKSRSGERSPSRVPSELTLYPLSCTTQTKLLFGWTPAALWFVAYQLINHEVSMYCSLSERALVEKRSIGMKAEFQNWLLGLLGTVFLNLCPLFALFIEPLVLPSRVENVLNQTFSSKMALITMAFGAVLFSLQYPDFTANGLRSAGLLVALVLPYRLLQRMLLAEPWRRFFLEAWNVWLHNPSIMLMFGLSIFAFIGNHLSVLYLLKATSATSTLVFGNLSNFVVVFEGIVFFSDPVFEAPLVFTGIALSLLGGVWYAIEQSDPADDGKINSMNDASAETASRLAQEGDPRFTEKFRYLLLFSCRGHREMAEHGQGTLRPKSPLQIPTFLSWSEEDDSKQFSNYEDLALYIHPRFRRICLHSQGHRPPNFQKNTKECEVLDNFIGEMQAGTYHPGEDEDVSTSVYKGFWLPLPRQQGTELQDGPVKLIVIPDPLGQHGPLPDAAEKERQRFPAQEPAEVCAKRLDVFRQITGCKCDDFKVEGVQLIGVNFDPAHSRLPWHPAVQERDSSAAYAVGAGRSRWLQAEDEVQLPWQSLEDLAETEIAPGDNIALLGLGTGAHVAFGMALALIEHRNVLPVPWKNQEFMKAAKAKCWTREYQAEWCVLLPFGRRMALVKDRMEAGRWLIFHWPGSLITTPICYLTCPDSVAVAAVSAASPSPSMVKRHVKGGKAMKKFGGHLASRGSRPKTKSQPWKVKSSIQKPTAKAEAAPKDVKMAPVKAEKAPKAPKPSKKERRKQRAAQVATKPGEKSPKASPKAKVAASPVLSKASPPGSPKMKPEMEVEISFSDGDKEVHGQKSGKSSSSAKKRSCHGPSEYIIGVTQELGTSQIAKSLEPWQRWPRDAHGIAEDHGEHHAVEEGKQVVGIKWHSLKLEGPLGPSGPSPERRTFTVERWAPSRREKRKYASLFQRSDWDSDGLISQSEAFQLAQRLDPSTLETAWSLSDVDRDGTLTLGLAEWFESRSRSRSRSVSPMPGFLSGPTPGGTPRSEQRTFTEARWAPSRREKRKYASLFERTDWDKDGFISQSEAFQLAQRSGDVLFESF
eukprot:s78_g48.t1